MSLSILPDFRPELKGSSSAVDCELILANIELLEKIAKSAKVLPLTAFMDNRSIPDDFDGDPEELDDLLGSWEDWFDAKEGLISVQKIEQQIATNPKYGKRLIEVDGLLDELSGLSQLLEMAVKKRSQFRLDIG